MLASIEDYTKRKIKKSPPVRNRVVADVQNRARYDFREAQYRPVLGWTESLELSMNPADEAPSGSKSRISRDASGKEIFGTLSFVPSP